MYNDFERIGIQHTRNSATRNTGYHGSIKTNWNSAEATGKYTRQHWSLSEVIWLLDKWMNEAYLYQTNHSLFQCNRIFEYRWHTNEHQHCHSLCPGPGPIHTGKKLRSCGQITSSPPLSKAVESVWEIICKPQIIYHSPLSPKGIACMHRIIALAIDKQ